MQGMLLARTSARLRGSLGPTARTIEAARRAVMFSRGPSLKAVMRSAASGLLSASRFKGIPKSTCASAPDIPRRLGPGVSGLNPGRITGTA